ncbi:MAG TPA: hypothetical protein HA355_03555 [Methanosphaera sp.]|nr:hypothetical protein [Methanosphaera sp.]
MENEKELAILNGVFYLKMYEGETQEEAEERFLNKLDAIGIEYLDTFVTEVRDY